MSPTYDIFEWCLKWRGDAAAFVAFSLGATYVGARLAAKRALGNRVSRWIGIGVGCLAAIAVTAAEWAGRVAQEVTDTRLSEFAETYARELRGAAPAAAGDEGRVQTLRRMRDWLQLNSQICEMFLYRPVPGAAVMIADPAFMGSDRLAPTTPGMRGALNGETTIEST